MNHIDWIKDQNEFISSLPTRYRCALKCYQYINIRYAIYTLLSGYTVTLSQLVSLLQPLEVLKEYCNEVYALTTRYPPDLSERYTNLTHDDQCYLISALQQLTVDLQYIVLSAPKSPTLFVYSPVVNPDEMELTSISFQNAVLSIQSMLPYIETGYYKIKIPKGTPILLLSDSEVIFPVGGVFSVITETKSPWKTNAISIKMADYAHSEIHPSELIESTTSTVYKLVSLCAVPKKINFTRS